MIRKKEVTSKVIVDVCSIWLPLDILYLYFNNGWNEHNRLILYLELVLLPLISLFGFYGLARYIGKLLIIIKRKK